MSEFPAIYDIRTADDSRVFAGLFKSEQQIGDVVRDQPAGDYPVYRVATSEQGDQEFEDWRIVIHEPGGRISTEEFPPDN